MLLSHGAVKDTQQTKPQLIRSFSRWPMGSICLPLLYLLSDETKQHSISKSILSCLMCVYNCPLCILAIPLHAPCCVCTALITTK